MVFVQKKIMNFFSRESSISKNFVIIRNFPTMTLFMEPNPSKK